MNAVRVPLLVLGAIVKCDIAAEIPLVPYDRMVGSVVALAFDA